MDNIILICLRLEKKSLQCENLALRAWTIDAHDIKQVYVDRGLQLCQSDQFCKD